MTISSNRVALLQVIEVCSAANRNMRIMRARFSALIPRELQRAMQQLVPPNAADAAAVDARQEIDLRVGASFTRMQTLLLQVGVLPCGCGLLHGWCGLLQGNCPRASSFTPNV
jgi:DNA topoisomerase IA